MSEWKKSRIKYNLKIKNGREITKDVENSKDSIPVYGSGGIFKYTNEFLYNGNAILFGRKGSIGKPLFVSGKFWTVDTMFYVIPKKNQNPKYYYYYLLIFPWSRLKTNTTIPSIVGTDVGNVTIRVPKVSLQNIIAYFLDEKTAQIDSLISSKERQIKLLEEQRQATITEAVTKGLNPNVKMKNSGVEWIGEIPEHWEVKKIKHLSQVKRGASPRPIDDPKYYAEDGDYSWVRISDVTKSGKYLFNTRDKLSELGASKSVKRHRGDLFLSIAATVGKACITKIDCCIHDGFVYFDNLKVEEEYLFYIFEAGQCYRGLGKMGTQLNLNTDTVGNITIPVSSRKEIQEIIDYITNKDVEFLNLINAVKRSKEKLKEYRQSLIHEAVTGKIPIEEMESYLKEAEKNGD